MNTGLVASRYALAFLRYVEVADAGELVINQVQTLLSLLYEEKEIALALESNSVSLQQKKEILKTLVYPQSLSDELYRLIVLLVKNERMELLKSILHYFSDKYYKSRKIKQVHLMTASPSEELEKRLETFIFSNTGCESKISAEVDPDLIGGFVLEMDGFRIDASVLRSLQEIRKEFIQKTEVELIDNGRK